MDLTNFMGSDVKKELFKITFLKGEEKIKTFLRATSKQHAKSLMETQLMKNSPDVNCRILDIKEVAPVQKIISD